MEQQMRWLDGAKFLNNKSGGKRVGARERGGVS